MPGNKLKGVNNVHTTINLEKLRQVKMRRASLNFFFIVSVNKCIKRTRKWGIASIEICDFTISKKKKKLSLR